MKIIFSENLVEHNFDVMAGVPVAVVIKAAGLFESVGKFDAAWAHEVNVGLSALSERNIFLAVLHAFLVYSTGENSIAERVRA
jgi:hypothetical protein